MTRMYRIEEPHRSRIPKFDLHKCQVWLVDLKRQLVNNPNQRAKTVLAIVIQRIDRRIEELNRQEAA